MEHVRHDSAQSFYNALLAAQGGDCMVANAPRLRCVGFMDYEAEKHHLLPVALLGSKVAGLPPGVQEQLGNESGLKNLLGG